jgi:hypothetical protein
LLYVAAGAAAGAYAYYSYEYFYSPNAEANRDAVAASLEDLTSDIGEWITPDSGQAGQNVLSEPGSSESSRNPVFPLSDEGNGGVYDTPAIDANHLQVNADPLPSPSGPIIYDSRLPGAQFDKQGIPVTEHFRNRLAERAATRGITESDALRAYNKGRLYYDSDSRNYIRYDPQTGVAVVVDQPTNGRAITVFEGNPSPDWDHVPWRPGTE